MDTVKSIKKKEGESSFSAPVPIGTEQRYIGPLRNTKANNLEEQLLLGFDCITQTWKRNDETWTEKQYWNGISEEGVPTEYYRLVTKVTNEDKYGVEEVINTESIESDYAAYINEEKKENRIITVATQEELDELDGKDSSSEDSSVITITNPELTYGVLSYASRNGSYMYYREGTDPETGEKYGVIILNPPLVQIEKTWLYYHVAGKGDTLLLEKEKQASLVTAILPNSETGEIDKTISTNDITRVIERIISNYLQQDSENKPITYGSPFTGSDNNSILPEEDYVEPKSE